MKYIFLIKGKISFKSLLQRITPFIDYLKFSSREIWNFYRFHLDCFRCFWICSNGYRYDRRNARVGQLSLCYIFLAVLHRLKDSRDVLFQELFISKSLINTVKIKIFQNQNFDLMKNLLNKSVFEVQVGNFVLNLCQENIIRCRLVFQKIGQFLKKSWSFL